jgi:hypothetical protein
MPSSSRCRSAGVLRWSGGHGLFWGRAFFVAPGWVAHTLSRTRSAAGLSGEPRHRRPTNAYWRNCGRDYLAEKVEREKCEAG